MIWELIKLDVAWRYVVRTTLFFSACVVLWHFLSIGGSGVAGIVFLAFFVPLLSLGVTPLVQPNDMRFQATLPVTVRQVFAARMLAILALQWLPVAAGAIILIALGHQEVSAMPLRTWSVVTCIVLGIQCAGIRRARIPAALSMLGVIVALGILTVVVMAGYGPTPHSFGLNLALGCCWLICLVVVSRTWLTLPDSFQLAPAEPSSAGSVPVTPDRARTHGAPWKPVLRTLFPFMGFEYVIYFLAMCAMHSPLFLYFVLISGQNWTSERMLIRWMLPLPVRPRTLLAAVVLPGMLSLTCGYLVGIHLTFIPNHGLDTGLRTQIVTVAFIAGWSLLANLCQLAGDWHTLRRALPSVYWSAIFAMFFMLVGLGLMAMQIFTDFDAIRWLASKLPASLGGTLAVSILLLGTLLWAIDAVFRRVEFADKAVPGVQL